MPPVRKWTLVYQFSYLRSPFGTCLVLQFSQHLLMELRKSWTRKLGSELLGMGLWVCQVQSKGRIEYRAIWDSGLFNMSKGPPAQKSYGPGNRNPGISGNGGKEFPGPPTHLPEWIRKCYQCSKASLTLLFERSRDGRTARSQILEVRKKNSDTDLFVNYIVISDSVYFGGGNLKKILVK